MAVRIITKACLEISKRNCHKMTLKEKHNHFYKIHLIISIVNLDIFQKVPYTFIENNVYDFALCEIKLNNSIFNYNYFPLYYVTYREIGAFIASLFILKFIQ